MPSLVILKDPTGTLGKEIHQIESGEYAIDVLMQYAPEGINQDTQLILLNGKKVSPTLEELEVALSDDDVLALVNEVKGVSTLVAAVVAVVSAVVAIALAPTPELPNQSGQQKQSPNNQLQGQSNIARTYQAWPLVLGSPVVYPDLIGEPIEEYKNDIKEVKQFFLVGFGKYEITEVRTESTPLSNFASANYTQYSPVNNVSTVPSYVTSFRASEVDGQILKGTNEQTAASTEYSAPLNATEQSGVSGNTATFHVDKNASTDSMKSVFDSSGSFQSTVFYEALLGTPGAGEPPEPTPVQGTGTVTAMTLVSNSYYEIVLNNFNGTGGIGSLPSPQTVRFSRGGSGEITAINTPVQCEDIWVNLGFNRGLRGADENTDGTVTLDIIVTKLAKKGGSSTGFTYTKNVTITARTLNPIFRTIKIDKANLNGKGWYRITIRRTNAATLNSSAPDEVRAESVQCLNFYTNKTFGDSTILEVNIPATQNATATRQTKINLTCASMTPTYNTTTKVVDTTLRASRKMADCILHMHLNYYGLNANLLDLDALYAIQNKLDASNKELARFDFTFDDNDISYQDRLETILNVARCYTWQDGDVWRFGRDEAVSYPSGLISRRDIAGENREYSITFNSFVSQNFDGIRLEYVDRSINKKAYVNKAISNTGTVLNQTSSNPKLIELAGCQSLVQATNRADLEVRKLMYQRETLVETCLPSMTFLDKGDVVLYSEQYETKTFDGEILEISGSTAKTTELIEWEAGKSYKVYFTLANGSLSGPHDITPIGINGSFYFTCTALTNAYTRDGVMGYQVRTGSRYIISETVELDRSRWRISSKESVGESETKFTMLNYDNRIYEAD